MTATSSGDQSRLALPRAVLALQRTTWASCPTDRPVVSRPSSTGIIIPHC
ncbi:hypothetical protein FM110_02075 [Brachybacterium nesterenkovii]|uniref:Uncharacterized protein n=1 Tax=Brachybacterium nesterenkovii TaxID=47847 RepID=A0A1X6WU29_9MICO|nr:hypothetical protein FM110_02075 [Brachybacterium nesterenkovii]